MVESARSEHQGRRGREDGGGKDPRLPRKDDKQNANNEGRSEGDTVKCAA